MTNIWSMHMTPRVNSSRPYRSFKMSKIQQKLLWHEALSEKVIMLKSWLKCRTVNSKWYATVHLPTVFGKIRKSNRNRRIILHQDNAGQNIKLMGHPACSLDLAYHDFFLFPHVLVKNKSDQRFSSPEETVDTLKNYVLEIPS